MLVLLALAAVAIVALGLSMSKENSTLRSCRGRLLRLSPRTDDPTVALPQPLTSIGIEENTTTVFPLPMEFTNLLNRIFTLNPDLAKKS
jgi:hypothetical protein